MCNKAVFYINEASFDLVLLVREYHNRVTCFAYRYRKGKNAVKRLHKELMEWALNICEAFLRGRRALDVGCAYGYTVELLEELGYEGVGIDLSASALMAARKLRGNFIVGDAEKLPFKGNDFDLITSFELIEHLAFPERFFEEVHRLLKCGGVLLLTTPIRGSLRQFYDVFGEKTHISLFKVEELISMLSKRSFQVRKLVKFTILPIPPNIFGYYFKLWKVPWDLLSTNVVIVAEKIQA